MSRPNTDPGLFTGAVLLCLCGMVVSAMLLVFRLAVGWLPVKFEVFDWLTKFSFHWMYVPVPLMLGGMFALLLLVVKVKKV